MSAYLYQRLLSSGQIPGAQLGRALLLAAQKRVSLIEALVTDDPESARFVLDCLGHDGAEADPAWRPDPRLLLDLPPGICEHLLSFPYRERAGAVEIATVSPFDDGVRAEFEAHFGRPVALFRGDLKGLLAAAGANLRLPAYERRSKVRLESGAGEAPIPLVRKATNRCKSTERTATSPGLGSLSLGQGFAGDVDGGTSELGRFSPAPSHREILEAENARSLAALVAAEIPPPALVFELNDGRLKLRAAPGSVIYQAETVSLAIDSGFSRAALKGAYVGAFFDCEAHAKFAQTFPLGAPVRIERVGAPDFGLIVIMSQEVAVSYAVQVLDAATEAWLRLSERTKP